ncbi:hypothetical protein D5274_17650 [bacterium 1XD42-94]|nr:hypothetical protein [bacterium 1XD42-76]NBK06894.1 hypothetical protein [bacterium 1XD42-94]
MSMNYEDELERSRARKSRKRTDSAQERGSGHSAGARTGDRRTVSLDIASHNGRSRGSSSARRKKKKPGNKKKRVIIGILLAILATVVLGVVGVFAYIRYHFNMANSQNDVKKKNVENLEIPQEDRERMEKGYWTVAVFGLDSRDSSTGAGNQSDVIMIVNINRETGEIKLVSVFRDTYLNISDRNIYNKINAAYTEGGPEQALKALNKNLDLNITDYATFNWKAVATAINILGGVDIDISKTEYYYMNAFITETVKGTGIGSVQLKDGPGTYHLDGVQAVAYGRLRLMDSDYARTERQRIIIQKAFEKAKKADLATLNSLVGNMCAMCATNINELDLLSMAKNVSKYHMGETMGFPAARGEQKIKIGSRRSDCVVPRTLVSNVTSLHKFLFDIDDYTPTNAVQTISNRIAEISGLNTAGKEIDHVATDQGYIPKTTAAPKTEAATEKRTTEAESSSESESGSETSENTMNIGPPIPGVPSEPQSSPGVPSSPAGVYESPGMPSQSLPGGTQPSSESPTQESQRPSSPLDVTRPTEHEVGPGHEPVEEATTGAFLPGGDSSPAGSQNTPGNTGTSGGQNTLGGQTSPGTSSPGTQTPPGQQNPSSTPGGSSVIIVPTDGSGAPNPGSSPTTAPSSVGPGGPGEEPTEQNGSPLGP